MGTNDGITSTSASSLLSIGTWGRTCLVNTVIIVMAKITQSIKSIAILNALPIAFFCFFDFIYISLVDAYGYNHII